MPAKKTAKKKPGKKPAKKITLEIDSGIVPEEIFSGECRDSKGICFRGNESGGFVYFLGFLASAFYYVTTAPDFWGAVIGFVKAIFWPAFIIYSTLVFIGA